MSVNINSFRLFVEFVSGKIQSGNSVTPPQFNETCQRAQMQLFERDYQTFLQTEDISEFLAFFLKNTPSSVPGTGLLPYPSDFEHTASIRKYYVPASGPGKMINVDEVKNVEWGNIQISALQEPTLRFPKFSHFSDSIRFLPRTIGLVEMDYFRTPVAPVWGFTVVNGRPVYSSAASTDFEWSQFAENSVASLYLSLIGINLREDQLLMFSQMYKNETNSKL